MRRLFSRLSALALLAVVTACAGTGDTPTPLRATGGLGVVIERASGQVAIVDRLESRVLARVAGLGDLSHASVVFSPDQRYAYVFGRDGGLSKIDLLTDQLVGRVMQAGNSIGGAISDDGRLIAVANYDPGGVTVFDAVTLEKVADLPATETGAQAANGTAKRSKVIGMIDAPGRRFVFSLWDTDEIWIADFSGGTTPVITRFTGIGRNPYDDFLTADGRWYVAGLFGEDGLARLDLWHPERGVTRVAQDYGQKGQKLPVYKMPHLEGWAVQGNIAYVPGVGRHEVVMIDLDSWQPVGRIPVRGQPIFVMARPASKELWVNFAVPDNDSLQIIDTEQRAVVETLSPGPGVLHMEFTPRGDRVWMSVRDADQVQVWDTARRQKLLSLPATKPSGIFFTPRANQTGL